MFTRVYCYWLISGAEWQLLDCALHAYGKVGVALYDTLGKDAVGEQIYLDSTVLTLNVA